MFGDVTVLGQTGVPRSQETAPLTRTTTTLDSPTVGSYVGGVPYERGTPIRPGILTSRHLQSSESGVGSSWLRVCCLGSGVEDWGSKVCGLEFVGQGLWFRVCGSGFGVWGVWFSLWSRVWGLWFRVCALGFVV